MTTEGDRERIEEARADEAAALAARLRARSLTAAVTEAMAAGDRVTVSCGDTTVAGTLVGVGGDHAMMTTVDGRVVVHLGGPISLTRRPSPSGGTHGDRSHGSFRARLATLEMAGDRVRVVSATGAHAGVVRAVAVDHLVLADDEIEHWLPLPGIGLVVSE